MAAGHYLTQVMSEIDKTHPHLGNPVAVAMLAVKAKKLLLMVSPRGCGKSRITSFVGLSYPSSLLLDRLSIAGLMTLQDEFTGFKGAVVVDDIAKTQTPYARVATLTTLAELIYSHYCVSHLVGAVYNITDFHGAGLVNIQPVLLRQVICSSEWEASLQDKSLRYYHLFRPLNPNPLPPQVVLDWGKPIEDVETPKLKGKLARNLMTICEVQWGLSRLKEHLIDFLKASAALDKRDKVTQADFKLLRKVLAPMQLEALVFTKTELEGERKLASDELAILTEFITYGSFTLEQLARDYKLSQSQCYRVMTRYQKDWVIVAKEPTTYAPSDELYFKLKGLGFTPD